MNALIYGYMSINPFKRCHAEEPSVILEGSDHDDLNDSENYTGNDTEK